MLAVLEFLIPLGYDFLVPRQPLVHYHAVALFGTQLDKPFFDDTVWPDDENKRTALLD